MPTLYLKSKKEARWFKNTLVYTIPVVCINVSYILELEFVPEIFVGGRPGGCVSVCLEF